MNPGLKKMNTLALFALAWVATATPEPTSAPTLQPTAATLEESMSVSEIDQYPGSYYVNKVLEDNNPDFYLGHIRCPGPSVCVPGWIGNGHCDDCFGCDQYMIATGFYGDCSTCDYFWSGGAVNVGEFDGGDCDDFVFPSSINDQLLDECLAAANFRTENALESIEYTQKRNTIILELEKGGWGEIAELQANTDVQLAAKCEYANIKECLRTNAWYDDSMVDLTDGDLRFEAAKQIEDLSTYQSIDLVYMSDVDLLGQCTLAGIHQKVLAFGWLTNEELRVMTGDQKRNHIIEKLSAKGKGTTAQLQTLEDTQLRYLLNHVDA